MKHTLTYKGQIFQWEIVTSSPTPIMHIYKGEELISRYTGDPHDLTREGVLRELKEGSWV